MCLDLVLERYQSFLIQVVAISPPPPSPHPNNKEKGCDAIRFCASKNVPRQPGRRHRDD